MTFVWRRLKAEQNSTHTCNTYQHFSEPTYSQKIFTFLEREAKKNGSQWNWNSLVNWSSGFLIFVVCFGDFLVVLFLLPRYWGQMRVSYRTGTGYCWVKTEYGLKSFRRDWSCIQNLSLTSTELGCLYSSRGKIWL